MKLPGVAITPLARLASQGYLPTARSQTGLFKRSTRLQSFTEEMCKWEFSREEVHRHGPAQFCVSGEDSLHLLSASHNMFGIFSCVPAAAAGGGGRETKLYLDLSESLPVDKETQILPALDSTLALFLPSYDTLFLTSVWGGKCEMLRLGGGWQAKRNGAHVMFASGEDTPGKFYFCGDDSVSIVQTDDGQMETVQLPATTKGGGSKTIRPIGRDEFLVDYIAQKDAARRALLQREGEGIWIWKELQLSADAVTQHVQANDWSLHRLAASAPETSYLQTLQREHSGGDKMQVLHSPRPSAPHSTLLATACSANLVCSAFPTHLEIITLDSAQVRTVPLTSSNAGLSKLAIHGQHVYTVSIEPNTGSTVVRKYETDGAQLERGLVEWKKMWGLPQNVGSDGLLHSPREQLAASKPPPEASAPKHGKVDNLPHVGGNTWAGGTGGSDTAGLGGRGGPYRLDKGHPVHQLSDEQKARVDQHVLDKARELNRLAYAERLKEISMNPKAHALYLEAKQRVSGDLERLRSVLDLANLEQKERVWERNQSFGELDDSKLVDGMCGERQIFKRRVLNKPSGFTTRALNVRLVVDCSASMYRFQSMDGRLQRMVDTTLMILEAVRAGELESKFRLSVVGHSGETAQLELVNWDALPENEAKLWNVLERMTAHAQYCMSGDTTVEALRLAVEEVEAQQQGEEEGGLVIVVSDANLRRYGIAPSELAREMKSDRVKTHVVFIASVRDEAELWARELPLGSARVCLDTSNLPHIIRDILSDAAV